jgi:anti-sigma28 factor (negative regulator of flagellin synthesis)
MVPIKPLHSESPYLDPKEGTQVSAHVPSATPSVPSASSKSSRDPDSLRPSVDYEAWSTYDHHLADLPEVRVDRIEALQRAVKEGTYLPPSAETLADKIIQDL